MRLVGNILTTILAKRAQEQVLVCTCKLRHLASSRVGYLSRSYNRLERQVNYPSVCYALKYYAFDQTLTPALRNPSKTSTVILLPFACVGF